MQESSCPDKELVIKAVKYYCENYSCFPSRAAEIRNFNELHYYPILYDDEFFYIHVYSLVAFCHRFNPDEFNELTRTKVQEYFNEIIKFNGITFRKIKKICFIFGGIL